MLSLHARRIQIAKPALPIAMAIFTSIYFNISVEFSQIDASIVAMQVAAQITRKLSRIDRIKVLKRIPVWHDVQLPRFVTYIRHPGQHARLAIRTS
jgi:hypothetical protein